MQSADELRHLLRARARAARKALGDEARAAAAAALPGVLATLPAWRAACRVGVYMAVASELSLAPVVESLRARGALVYLPHVEVAATRMHFAPWHAGRRLIDNHFGIPEPMVEAGELTTADQLDLVLLPLLAFDRHGGRLGSGAGFYDRALSERRLGAPPPLLVGAGYACQEVETIPLAAWDVPLDAIATEAELIQCRGKAWPAG